MQTNISKSITASLGDSLSKFDGITFLLGDSPDDLERQLRELKIPFKIVSMYAQGTKHIAWINADRPIIKRKK